MFNAICLPLLIGVLMNAPGEDSARVRRPSALALVDDGSTLLAANRGTGTISVIDTKEGRVVAKWEVGRGLADLAVLRGGTRLLAVDPIAKEVILLDRAGRSIKVIGKIETEADPIAIAVAKDESRAGVASRWGQSLSIIDLVGLKTVGSLALSFAPGRLLRIEEAKVIVADAYGGGFAIVDLVQTKVISTWTLPVHNIGGLCLSPDGKTFAFTHQSLSRLATTSFDDIHWGSTIANRVRLASVDSLMKARSFEDALKTGIVIELDRVGNAAGDPGGIALGGKGELVVALAGVGQVAIGGVDREHGPRFPSDRVQVGARPTNVVLSLDGSLAYVAETFNDAIAVVELPAGRIKRTISLGPLPDPNRVSRGERLFFDARLSHDGWMSCHSCHSGGHTNGLVVDTLGDGSYGTPKLTPSLLGVGTTGPWNWLGKVDRLEDQVRQSIETTMRGKPPTDDVVADLSAYLRSLVAPPPLPPKGKDSRIEHGAAVFRASGCLDCHRPPAFTSSSTYDVGLADEQGVRKFNPPSLLGVGRRSRFLHDGRAKSLAEVLLKERHPTDHAVPDADVDDLIRYLESL